jgi:hypothetical protein
MPDCTSSLPLTPQHRGDSQAQPATLEAALRNITLADFVEVYGLASLSGVNWADACRGVIALQDAD